MSSVFDVKVTQVELGAITGAGPFPGLYVPPNFGAITLLAAKALGGGAGTSIGLKLITLSNAGTPVANGTLGSAAGTVVYAAGVPAGITLSSAVVDPGTTGIWIGVEQASGTAPVNTGISLSWLQGK
jgi:hypothetical protein